LLGKFEAGDVTEDLSLALNELDILRARIKELENLYDIEGENRSVLLRSIDPLNARIASLEKVVEAAEKAIDTEECLCPPDSPTCDLIALRAALAALKEST